MNTTSTQADYIATKFLKRLTLAFGSLALPMMASASIPNLPPITKSNAGFIEGSFGVSETGASTYNIELPVPPGTGGIKPKLSLSYNSRHPNKLIGLGWSLTGLPAITRCATTIAQDGMVDTIDFDDNDKYCLDGQRLISINGSIYGQNGAEYRTENESFARIHSYDLAGSGPSWFLVETKNGLTYEYGATDDSRIEAEGRVDVLAWKVNKISDTLGNYLTVQYYEDNSIGESYPLRIDYTGNEKTGLIPYNSVRFNYETRTDIVPRYISGSLTKLTKRLKKVSLYTDDMMSWEYNLSYQYGSATARSQLIGIQECGATENCMTPTTFDWQQSSDGTFDQSIDNPFGSSDWSTKAQLGDVDGDGYTDFVYTGSGALYVRLANGDGTFGPTIESSFDSGDGSTKLSENKLGDFNGDGLIDFIVTKSSTLSVRLSNGDGTFGQTINSNFTGSGWNDKAQLGDFNSNGITDYIYIGSKALYVRLSNGDGTFGPIIKTLFSSTGWDDKARLSDFNSDGNSDYLYTGNKALYVRLSKGDGTFGPIIKTLFSSTGWDDKAQLGDFNSDGNVDYIYTGSGSLYVRLSNGDGSFGSLIESPFINGSGTTTLSKNKLADLNGDGLTDFIITEKSTLSVRLTKSKQTDLLIKIKTGNSATITINYAPLTDDSVYSKGQNATYPVRNYEGPMYVVKNYLSPDGIGGQVTTSYFYTDLKIGTHGRGFCGFLTISAIKSNTGIETKTFYRQDHPYKSNAYKTETRLSNGTLISRSESSWDVIDYEHGGYSPYISKIVEEDFKVDGTFVSSIATSSNLDTFGNTIKVLVSYSDGYTEETINTYNNDETKWILGRLTEAKVTKKALSKQSLTKTSSFQYSSINGLLIRETIEPNHPLSLQKDYGHDAYGNITSTTLSGAGIGSQTTISTYDIRGQFEISTTNALGHTQIKEYDKRHGTVKSLTNPNGLITNWSYDAFGRELLETLADGTKKRTRYLLTTDTEPEFAHYIEKVDLSGQPPLIVYRDILNRKIREERVGFDGTRIYTDTQYNSRGEMLRVSEPYFIGSIPLWTNFEYDEVSRLLKSIKPGFRIASVNYNGLSTTTINTLDQSNTITKNQRGKTLEVIDNDGNKATYDYDSYENLIRLTDAAGNNTLIEFDILNNKTKIVDPDSGTSTFMQDAKGRITRQTDAKNQNIFFNYDLLDRVLSRQEPEGTSTWIYDEGDYSKGKIISVIGIDGYTKSFEYDNLTRLKKTTIRLSSTDPEFETYQIYDDLSRPQILKYPSGFEVRNIYNDQGYLEKVVNHTSGEMYWQAKKMNARGNLEQSTVGNGLTTTKTYDIETGFLNEIITNNVQHLNVYFDDIGNLVKRRDEIIGAEENISYDSLNRLTQAKVVNGSTINVSYNKIGNITQKSDVGSYTYGQGNAGPHAVTQISGSKSNNYTYGNNGNRISDNSGHLQYTSFNKPHTVVKNFTSLVFDYAPERQRVRQREYDGLELIKTKLYIGSLYEEHTGAGITKKIHYIKANGSTIAIFNSYDDNSLNKLRYLHKDHLGSIQTITDENGNVVETLSFDAWGKRRNADWSIATNKILSGTDRGFTGHEQLDSVDLIHMGGRVYDPIIGRFLSPDPFVQAPENPQNLNRYSYVLNNPLSYSDPSGFFFKSIARFIKKYKATILSVAITIATGGWASGVLGLNIITAGAIGGFAGSSVGIIISGGDIGDALSSGLRGAAAGGLSAGLADGVATAFGHTTKLRTINYFKKIVAHGTSSGVVSIVQGGKFQHGFISGGFISALAPGINRMNLKSSYSRVVVASVVGGGAAEIGGGKFANGAVTGAFIRLFNDELKIAMIDGDPFTCSAGETSLCLIGGGGGGSGARSALATKKGVGLSKSQLKSIKSLEKQIQKHQQKIDDFKTNPTVRPGMENLPKDMIHQQQKARINHFETEINTFKNNIDKIKNGGL